VLYRGYVRDEPTPFRPYAKDKGEKGPGDLPPELQGGDKKLAFVWGRETRSWIPSKEEGSVDPKSTNLVPTNEPLNRRDGCQIWRDGWPGISLPPSFKM